MTVDPVALPTGPALSSRKAKIRELSEKLAPTRAEWLARNAYYYDDDRAYMRFLVPEKLRILELGCGNGQLLAALAPSYGLGIDISPGMVEAARKLYPHLDFRAGDIEDSDFLQTIDGKFDVIVLSDSIGYLEDCQSALSRLHRFCVPETRLIIGYYSKIWEPVLRFGQRLGWKMPTVEQNWLSSDDIANLLMLTDFEPHQAGVAAIAAEADFRSRPAVEPVRRNVAGGAASLPAQLSGGAITAHRRGR